MSNGKSQHNAQVPRQTSPQHTVVSFFLLEIFTLYAHPKDTVLKKYIDYLRDNPNKYWFKRKLFGWGWVPVTWQGYAVTFVYIAIILLLGSTVDENSSTREMVFMLFLPFILLTITFIRIAYRTGEKPKWQWGLPKKDE